MDHDKQTPPTARQSDPDKPHDAQQPTGQSQAPQPTDQASSGPADDGSAGQPAGQSDTTTQQRSDIEGGTATGQATDIEAGAQFVGAQSASDTSSDLIEDDESSDFAKDSPGAPE